MQVGMVSGLWRYPVKSMGGERLAAATLSWRGIPGDRAWAVHDESRNGVTNAKRLPGLRGVQARYPGEPVPGAAPPPAELVFSDGTSLLTDSPDAAERLSGLFGRPVTLRSLGPEGSEAAPRVAAAGDTPETFRAMMGILPDEPMPDLSEFTPERLRVLREGNFFDAFPFHLLTSSTLETLARRAPESAWDERRFRPNVLVETGGREGFPELEWPGRMLRVGSAVLEVVTGCPRCVVVTQPVDELAEDRRVMRTLVREARHTAGVYARAFQVGDVRVGDGVEILA